MTWWENRGDVAFPFRQRKDLKMYYRCHLLLSSNLLAKIREKDALHSNPKPWMVKRRVLSRIWRGNHAQTLLIQIAAWKQCPGARGEKMGHLLRSWFSTPPPHVRANMTHLRIEETSLCPWWRRTQKYTRTHLQHPTPCRICLFLKHTLPCKLHCHCKIF